MAGAPRGVTGGGMPGLCRESRGQKGGAGTWALFAAVGGAGAHGVGTGEPRALHLLTVHFARGALRGGEEGAQGGHEAVGTRHAPPTLA